MTESMRTSRSYAAFGLVTHSDIELDGFESVTGSSRPDVTVRASAPVPGHDGDMHVGARAEGVLLASVRNGDALDVEVDPTVDPSFASAVITGELFSVLLRQRGNLVLHGSGVAKNGRAIGFVGGSGWGKSTLAATLIRRGWEMVTDDLLVVSMANGTPTVIPSHPSMRLSVDAARVVDAPDQTRAHDHTSKVRVDWPASFSGSRQPLTGLFVLETKNADAHRSVRLSALNATVEFICHTRGTRLLDSPRAGRSLLEDASGLARAVPTSALHRRLGLEHLEELCDLVESLAVSE